MHFQGQCELMSDRRYSAPSRGFSIHKDIETILLSIKKKITRWHLPGNLRRARKPTSAPHDTDEAGLSHGDRLVRIPGFRTRPEAPFNLLPAQRVESLLS